MTNKFVYEEGDLQFASTLCAFCVHFQGEEAEGCAKFEKRPEEVLNKKTICPSFEKKRRSIFGKES